MASRQSGLVRQMYQSWADALRDPDPIEPAGEGNDHWGDITAEPRGVDYLETDAAGVPAMWIAPTQAAHERVILALHGGGFMGGSLYTHRKLFGHLAKAVGARALAAHYRLNPAHHHPAPQQDATTAYRWLLDQGVEAGHIAFAGDSSGGGLCVTAALSARDQGLPLPAALLLMSPWVDMELTGGTYESNKDKDPFFHRELVQGLVDMHLADTGDPRDPSVNPLYADLAGLPPMFIQAGADECGLDDALLLDRHARSSGVQVRLEVFPEQLHTFQMAAGTAPEANQAIGMFAEWARPLLGLG
ncbi:MAG: epsilon-lactone hydrolase [Mycobacteriales bacterium]